MPNLLLTVSTKLARKRHREPRYTRTRKDATIARDRPFDLWFCFIWLLPYTCYVDLVTQFNYTFIEKVSMLHCISFLLQQVIISVMSQQELLPYVQDLVSESKDVELQQLVGNVPLK